jgi:hypothetical protein
MRDLEDISEEVIASLLQDVCPTTRIPSTGSPYFDPPALCSLSNTWSRLKLAAFWRGR